MDKLEIVVARIEEQLKATREDIAEYHNELREHAEKDDKRFTSLEHSRTRLRTGTGVVWAVLIFLGWDTIADWLGR